jgi:hypothetical protein
MRCVWCDQHEYLDEKGKPDDHRHWCKKYRNTCHFVLKGGLCPEEKIKAAKKNLFLFRRIV